METIHQIYYYMFDSAFPMFDGAFPAAVGPFLFNFPMSLKWFYFGENNKKGHGIFRGTKSTRALTNNLDSSLPTMRQISLKFAFCCTSTSQYIQNEWIARVRYAVYSRAYYWKFEWFECVYPKSGELKLKGHVNLKHGVFNWDSHFVGWA